MNKTLSTLFAASALVLGVQQADAVPITGTVDMSGTAFLDNTLLGSATAATSFGSVTVGGVPDGAYTGTAGASVTWSPFAWNPASTPVTPLWTFTSGLTTYSFDLTSVSVVSQDNQFLNLAGVGTLKATGYSDTGGTWSFTISNPTGGAKANFAFTFANSQTAAVPDGGATAMLLGLGFIGVAALRRQIS